MQESITLFGLRRLILNLANYFRNRDRDDGPGSQNGSPQTLAKQSLVLIFPARIKNRHEIQ
jgi:hypothetical protein